VPESLTWTAHAHGERQQVEEHLLCFVVMVDERIAASHPSVVIHVYRLGDADDWMEQEAGVGHLHGALGHLFVGAVERGSRLERNDVLPTSLRDSGSHLSRCFTQMREIEVLRWLQHLERAADVIAALSAQGRDARMALIDGTEDVACLLLRVVRVDLFHVHDS
jgi:hypothetical protein